LRSLAFVLAMGVALSGCSNGGPGLPSWLGGSKADNTVLPGQREEVLPSQKLPRGNAGAAGATTNQAGTTRGKLAAPTEAACEASDPNYPECLTPDSSLDDVPQVDEESAVPEQ
jgi:hypothetical protein